MHIFILYTNPQFWLEITFVPSSQKLYFGQYSPNEQQVPLMKSAFFHSYPPVIKRCWLENHPPSWCLLPIINLIDGFQNKSASHLWWHISGSPSLKFSICHQNPAFSSISHGQNMSKSTMVHPSQIWHLELLQLRKRWRPLLDGLKDPEQSTQKWWFFEQEKRELE